MDSSMQSSPDPLNASQSQSFNRSPTKTRRAPRVRTSLPLQGSSPKKQTFELDVGNRISPQKIRVTVEAGESDIENTYGDHNGEDDISPTPGPVSRRRERTTTTIVPLKGLSDSEEEIAQTVATPKRGRGRPRKTAGTPVPAKKKAGRSSTPTQRTGRRKSVGEPVDGDDEEDINFELGKGVEISRGKKGSRSRSRKGAKSKPATKPKSGSEEPSVKVPKKRGRRKSLPPAEIDVLEDESHVSNTQESEQQDSEAVTDNDARYSDSPVSTMPSTTSQPTIEPDVIIARFNPGNETPHRTGWSSPRVFEAEPSGTRRRSDNYPSPSLSVAKLAFEKSDREAIASMDEQLAEDDYEDEAEDGVGEMREFDTILESEGFSMISVDSVPSLREHLSSPAERLGTSGKKAPVMKSFLAVQDADASAYNDSFSEIPEEILAAATPAKPAQTPRLFLQSTEDSIARRSPGNVTPRHKESSRPFHKESAKELNNSSMQAPTSMQPSPARAQYNEDYDDSFSVIPAEILGAATPAAARQQRPETTAQALPLPRSAPSPSHARSTSGSRLLTPDKSPSPPSASSKLQSTEVYSQASSSRPTQDTAANESSFMHSQLPSSPPVIAPRRYTYTAHLRQNRQFNSSIAQTPSIVFSSPSLPPPPVQAARGNHNLAPTSEHSDRPPLSPIARAGRMLQSIVVPSSPRSRSQSLGSPFKSPATDKRSSSILDQSQMQNSQLDRRPGPLPQLDLSTQLSASSVQRQRSNRQHDDPFQSSGSRSKRSPSPGEQQEYSLGVPRDRGYSDPRISSLRSKPAFVRSDSDMSWQAEEEIPVPFQPTSSSQNLASTPKAMTAEERWSADRAEVIKQVELADTDRLIVIDSDDENFNNNDDDEGFGQLLETLNSSSPAAPKEQELARDIGEKPRRSKIPSPWRKNSKRLVYSDELTQLSSPHVAEKVAVATKIARESISQPITVRRISDPELSFEGDSADFSGWQIPQKSNFNPRPRENYNADLSALFAASPPKPLPVLTKAAQQPITHLGTSSNKTAACEPSSERIEPVHELTNGFAPIPQKAAFNPRPRAAGLSSPVKSTLGPNLFTRNSRDTEVNTPPEPSSSSSYSRPLTASSPSRTNTLAGYRTPSAQVSPLNSDQDSSLLSISDKENQIANSRTLKWTETLELNPTRVSIQPALLPTTSPSKSCLRSPMKTPRQPSSSENTSPSKAVAFVSSSPVAPSPTVPLSSTTWSKEHWRTLDTILQQWKPENQTTSPSERRRNSTRVISKLLGKTVSSQGQKLVLEQWHLEVVDEFRGLVDGWEEKDIAMRVFSLLIGEEKRALKLAGETVAN